MQIIIIYLCLFVNTMFVDRHAELDFLNNVLTRKRPGPGQLILLYGRRRVGKTALLRHWAEQSNVPWTYWMAQREPALLQRRRLTAALLGRSPTATDTPTFDSWPDLWDAAAQILRGQRHILILDELPYAAEADSAMLSALQYAWDTHFQHSEVVLVLCGSHVRSMETLLSRQSPLFGRMTGQWHLQPLPFGCLRHFFPEWTPDEQVAAYAIVGGVPAYLAWFEQERPLTENIRRQILAPGSLALAEVEFLLYDDVREPRSYLNILQAIGNGAHALKDIANATMIATTNLTTYLGQLQELRLVERRLPATVLPNLRQRSKQGRYHLTDPFHRFYFRFLQPNQAEISYQPDRVLPLIQQGLRAFVGQTAWEELARQWVWRRGMERALPFVPEVIGSHWSRRVQVDVVAINWKARAILLGECKWGDAAVDRQTVRDLIERTVPLTLADLPDGGTGWQVYPALFARAGATSAARETLTTAGGILVDLPRLFTDLAEA
jgi:AAA+ ATPase superfamily predicted ATPase